MFQGCGQLIRVIMHGVRGHVHGAQGGGCCCSLEKKKSAKACFQIRELPRSLQLMRKSLETDIVHISAGEEDKNFNMRQTLN